MRPILLPALLLLAACGPNDDTAAEPGIEPASGIMLASAQWVWDVGQGWSTYQRAVIPLVFMADEDTQATGPRSEHCRVQYWSHQQEGVSPIQLDSSLLSVTMSWDPDGYYDADGSSGEDPFATSGDTLTATAEGLEASVAAPPATAATNVLGNYTGFDTPVYAEGFDLVWSWITGSETAPSIYCVVAVDELEVGEYGPWTPAVPQDGQDLWDATGLASEELYVGLATAVEVEGFFDDPTRLMAARVYKMQPE